MEKRKSERKASCQSAKDSWVQQESALSWRKVQPVGKVTLASSFIQGGTQWWLPISAAGRLNLYCQRAPREGRMGGTKVIA